MSYRLLEHTADLAVEVRAPTREQLLAEAQRAFTDCITDLGTVRARICRSFEIRASDAELLLVEWLGELVSALDVEGLLFARSEVEIVDHESEIELRARAWGEEFDPRRHSLKSLVKAVTYHGLEVRSGGDGWRARVIFDI